ncbi:hypothetical protein [Asticcacaulis sp. AC402]|uniref:hypothetical protein n=1 Tax=Asticcacaulis sp. AC402 TaxID=1282361 RepID=UPI0003C3CCF7|nr:hypothetical protein [Asticcacaulis sp. AC402]ESQ76417.1 hypothetical protein ABAC402_04775 [Asticcacaulis sp. AC402]
MITLKSALLTMILSATVAAVALPAAAHCPDGKDHSHKVTKKTVKKAAKRTAVACNCAKPVNKPRKVAQTPKQAPRPAPEPETQPRDYAWRSSDTYYNDQGPRSPGVNLYQTSWESSTVTTRVVSHRVVYIRLGDGRLLPHAPDCHDRRHRHVAY